MVHGRTAVKPAPDGTNVDPYEVIEINNVILIHAKKHSKSLIHN